MGQRDAVAQRKLLSKKTQIVERAYDYRKLKLWKALERIEGDKYYEK
jgi:hypothetical protein